MGAAAKDHESIPNGAESELLALLETLYNSRNPTRRWLHCTRRDWITAKVAEYAKGRSRRALEVGFGAGAYLPALCEVFREVVASDLDQSHVDYGRAISAKYPNLRLATDDITSSRLPERTFDLILCSEVIEHVGDTNRVLSGIRRLLAPGGILILSTPQRYSLIEMACKVAFMPGMISIVRRIYGEPVLEAGHINLMTAQTLTRALEGQGFNVLERFKSGMYLPFLAEFAGDSALRLEQWMENKLRNGPLSWMLWTQYYVARRLDA
jgi:2-polyprenyl-3-methyl-5-hydroxy-6-metoxy-1,4-benzoquinol methylase